MNVARYEWKDGSRVRGIDADDAGTELERIRKTDGGTLTPEAVLKEAKKKSSILHSHFEWDDSKAAKKYRDVQAREMIRSLVVILSDEDGENEKPIRAFVNVEQTENHEYHNVVMAMSDEEMRGKILARALEELESWQRRYAEYKELGKVMKAIEAHKKKHGKAPSKKKGGSRAAR